MNDMAINSNDIYVKIDTKVSANNSKGNNSCCLVRNFTTNSTTSTATKSEKKKLKKHGHVSSPYLVGDRIQLLSRVTEKKFVHKKTMDYMSSFPLAVNIYKANSGEFKTMRSSNKKNKKSVLTLPNEPALEAQICTVSDINDSEYYSRTNINCKPRLKRATSKNVHKPRVKNKKDDIYETDYHSRIHINLDSNQTDLLTRYKGDGKSNYHSSKQDFKSSHFPTTKDTNNDGMTPHDVWAMLRNINRFQFNPSPPMSDESIPVPKKKKGPKKRINRKDTRVFETCRTEEFAYISSYKADDSSRSITQSSSFDRITVIENNDEFTKHSNKFEDRFLKIRCPQVNNPKSRFEGGNRIQKRRIKNVNVKNLCYPLAKEKRTEIAMRRDSNLMIQSNVESSQEGNEVSFLINKDDLQSAPFLVDASVSSNTNKNSRTELHPIITDKETHISGNSSKMEITIKGVNKLPSQTNNYPTLNGLPQVALRCSNQRETTTSPTLLRFEAQKRKPRLATTMPSTCMLPKLTQTEIRRRLATMRFPIIILAKEQVSSSIELQNIDPPQFDGLDKHIWPFMMEWDENTLFSNKGNFNEDKTNICQINNNNESYDSDQIFIKLNNTNKDAARLSSLKAKKTTNDTIIKNKLELKKIPVSPKLYTSEVQKPITYFKDRMLNLLYKKVSGKTIDKDYHNELKRIVSNTRNGKMNVEASTEAQVKSIAMFKDSPKTKDHESSMFLNKKAVISFKYPWAKAKRASDFIENVIRNIKNGVYYSKDHKYVNRSTEIAMQTDATSDQEEICENCFSPKVTIKKRMMTTIPGFDNSLLGLEIKTLNRKQITIKHCLSNVMIQFDVTVPADLNKIATSPKFSPSVIPVGISENHMKIFKCKKSILNAMLPAELCSIIPRMMKAIDLNFKTVLHSHCSGIMDKTVPSLSTINELSRIEVITESNKCFESLVQHLSPLQKILKGIFSKTHKNYNEHVVSKYNSKINYECRFVINLLPKLITNISVIMPETINSFNPTCLINRTLDAKDPAQSVKDVLIELTSPYSTCTSLEVYSTKNKRLIPAFEPYNFATFVKTIAKRQAFLFNTQIYFGTNMSLYMNIKITIHNTENIPALSKNFDFVKHHSNKPIEYIKQSAKCICENKDQQSEHLIKVTSNKNKRKRFYKLYRKCKSASNIPSTEKSTNISLSKIQTLEDFVQILGSKELLSGVFDGYAAKKILTSIVEIKNWITEINPKQALLILLLTNKKDTPNLIRFRPVLLQGIAVNRITRATELDMEIEVIERENLNKLPQYEGISYLTDSIENHDQLLEELYWIAKTTASDYQRPFDETSERLLKSLLEKRKKLNPSYLRVMARYVGLGLLKTPTKK